MINMTPAGMSRKLALMRFCWNTGGDLSSRWTLARAFFRLAGDHGKFRCEDRVEIRGCVGDTRPLRLTIRDRPSDLIEFREIFFDREYRACADLGFEPKAIYDIGANVGLAAAYFRARWPSAVIIGFEAEENEFAVAERNYARLGAARLFHVAAGNFDGEIDAAPEQQAGGADDEDADQDAPKLRVRRLDTMIRRCELPLPDLIKIDVVGHGLEVLEGLGDCLAGARGVLLETHSQASHEAGRRRLLAAGFEVKAEVLRGEQARVLLALRTSGGAGQG